MMNKDEFVILRVTSELKKKIAKRAKEVRSTVSKVIREIIENNL